MPLRLPHGVAGPEARRAITEFLSRHRRLPLLALPADTVNTAATQLPVFIVTARFGAGVGGWLALAMRTLGAPIALLGSSVLDVFRRHAATAWREQGNCRADYLQTFWVLALGSGLMSAFVALFNEELFVLAFGEEWRRAGVIALWLLPLFALRFVASPLSYVFYVAQKQHVDLLWQCALLAVTLATLNIAADYESALISYAMGYGVLYIVYLGLSYRLSGGQRS
jgi:O-antigen/teichoic acid export membrane protein